MDSTPLSAMMRALRHRGRDGSRVVTEHNFALGVQRFVTMTEDVRDPQPLRDAWGATCIAFDGRLDNREALGRKLGLRGPRRHEMSDAAIVMAAWESYDLDCFAELEGSFAIVILDMRRNRAILARDPLGTRALYYRLDSNGLVAASEESSLLQHPAVSDRLNEDRLIQHLAFEFPGNGSTFFSDIEQILPGQVMTVGANQTHRHSFFDPQDIEPVRYRDMKEYAEHYREVVGNAVRACSRSIGDPALMLSGGLDSTTIASFMARQRGSVSAFNWSFSELQECDESRWIDPLLDTLPINLTRVQGDDCWPLRDMASLEIQRSHPMVNPYRELRARTYRAAAMGGHKVLLAGVGGDELFLEDGHWLSELCADGRYGQALSGLRQGFRHDGVLNTLRGGAVRRALGLAGVSMRSRADQPWLAVDTAKKLADIRAAQTAPGHHNELLRQKQLNRLFGAHAAEDTARESAHDSRHGIEIRSPFRTLAVAKFAIAIPAFVLHKPGQSRYLLRYSMREFLPKIVLDREQKTSFIDLFHRGLIERREETIVDLLPQIQETVGLHFHKEWLNNATHLKQMSAFEQAVFWNCLSTVLWQSVVASASADLKLSA